MGLMQRQKGKRVEREVAKLLNELIPDCHARRTQQFCGKEGTSDITAEGPLAGWHIESKGLSMPVIPLSKIKDWYTQIRRDAGFGVKAVIFAKLPRQDFIVIVPAKDCSCFIQESAYMVIAECVEKLGYNVLNYAHRKLGLARSEYYKVYHDGVAEPLIYMTAKTFAKMVTGG